MDHPAIAVRGLTKRYGKAVALEALDLDVAMGTIVGVLGSAGAGKSTLIRVLAGLTRPDAGTVQMAGDQVRWGDGVAARRRIGVVLQDAELPRWMTGRDVLAFMADLAGVAPDRMPASIAAAAALLSIEEALDRPVRAMPAPARARLAIAQALVGEPVILLLDEPFESLDAAATREVAAVLGGMRGARTIVVTGPRVLEPEMLLDRVVTLEGGRVIADDSVASRAAAVRSWSYVIETDSAGSLAAEGLVARLRAEPWVREVVATDDRIRVVATDEERAARELLPAVVATGLRITAFRREMRAGPPTAHGAGEPTS